MDVDTADKRRQRAEYAVVRAEREALEQEWLEAAELLE